MLGPAGRAGRKGQTIVGPLRLLALLMAVVVIGAPILAVVLFLIAVIGSPGSCETEGRPISYTPALAASFQEKWDQLNDTLNAGQLSTIVVDEGEATSRAQLWVEEHDVPVSDLRVCFGAEGGSASGKVDIPFFPGDVDILVKGTMILTGEHPEAGIAEMEVGGLPGPFTDLVEGFVTGLIEQETKKIALPHDYGLAFAEGEATVSGQP